MFQAGVGELTASSLPESLVPRVRRQPGVPTRRRSPSRRASCRAGRRFSCSGSSRRASSTAASSSSPAAAPAARARPCWGTRPRPRSSSTSATTCGCRRDVPRRRHLPRRGPVRGPGRRAPAARRRADPRAARRRDHDRGEAPARRARDRGRRAAGTGVPGTVSISQPGQVARVDTNSLLIRKAATVRRARADHRRHRGDEHDADGRLRPRRRVRPAARGRLAAAAGSRSSCSARACC